MIKFQQTWFKSRWNVIFVASWTYWIYWNRENLPDKWKKFIIVPFYKMGNETDSSNYRGIALLLTSYRISSNIFHMFNVICSKICFVCTSIWYIPLSKWYETRKYLITVAFQLCFREHHKDGPRKPGRIEIERVTSSSGLWWY